MARPSTKALRQTFFPEVPGTSTVYERAYAGNDAQGNPKPTMDLMTPEWARWFNIIKENTGSYPVFVNQGGARHLPTSTSLDEEEDALNADQRAQKLKASDQNAGRFGLRYPRG